MGIFNRIWRDLKSTNRSGMVLLTGSFTTTTSGAIDTSDTPGFTVTKTGSKAGRYRVQLVDRDGVAAAPAQPVNAAGTAIAPWGIQAPSIIVCSSAADAALTKDLGWKAAIRNFTPLSGYFDFQFYNDYDSTGDTHPDVEVETGSVVLLSFWAKLSSVTP